MCHKTVRFFDDLNFNKAYDWLYRQRKRHSHNADLWSFRQTWAHRANNVRQKIKKRSYLFQPVQQYKTSEGLLYSWSAQDAFILKVLALSLSPLFNQQLSQRCFHLAGRSGTKGALRDLKAHLPEYRYIFKTDVKNYYASMDHVTLMGKLAPYVQESMLTDLIWKYLRRVETRGGLYWEPQKGITKGSALSPLMGAVYLSELDMLMTKSALGKHVRYYRYQDNIIILAKTRCHFKRAIKLLKEHMRENHLTLREEKTFIGKTQAILIANHFSVFWAQLFSNVVSSLDIGHQNT